MMTVTYIGQVLTGANASVINLAFAGLAILLHLALTRTSDSE
jgi:hypothetical protein